MIQQKTAEVPQVQYIGKFFVDVPVVVQRHVPTVHCAETVQVPQVHFTVDVPVVLRIFKSEASVLIDLMTKFAKKLLVEPSTTVGLVFLQKRAKQNAPLF